MIQRLAKGFGHAPDFLEKGGLINNNVEQIKYTAAFLLSSFIMGFQQGRLDLFKFNSFVNFFIL